MRLSASARAEKALIVTMTLALLVVTSCYTPRAKAWWDMGHSAVCEAALQWLTPEARLQLETLLSISDDSRFIEPETFGRSCTWADRIKPKRRDTAPWHYFNVPAGILSVTGLPKPKGGDALTALEQQVKLLGDANNSPESRAEALRWVGHLVGDIHQPMHVGYEDDWGGNKYRLQLPESTAVLLGEKERQSTNMHAVWDGYLLIFASKAQGQSILAQVVDGKVDSAAGSQELDPTRWANESLLLLNAPSVAYATDNRLASLESEYLEAHSDTAIARLRLAGIRLARLLNLAFSKGGLTN